jgi:hypothetical protein
VLFKTNPVFGLLLGENVKQANWELKLTRFPQTRMGVEQVFYGLFPTCLKYDAEWKNTIQVLKDKSKAPR